MKTFILVFSVVFPANISSVWMEFSSKETCEKAGIQWSEKLKFETQMGKRIEWICLEK
jgi:hypothetical protein